MSLIFRLCYPPVILISCIIKNLFFIFCDEINFLFPLYWLISALQAINTFLDGANSIGDRLVNFFLFFWRVSLKPKTYDRNGGAYVGNWNSITSLSYSRMLFPSHFLVVDVISIKFSYAVQAWLPIEIARYRNKNFSHFLLIL